MQGADSDSTPEDSPLSSKVAMFNNQVQQHKQSQRLNPFSGADGRASPKPTFSKDEYGKPLAGSLTEMRGQKANMHVLREMLELCQIIDSEGYSVKDEPKMRVIPFGELFNIYNYISDKVVGILLRARKHKLVQFEGEMLFQRRDDDVPIFLLRPIADIRHELQDKIEEIKRGSSPAPLATSLLMDKGAHAQKMQESGLAVPGSRSGSKSRSPSPSTALSATVSLMAGTPAPSPLPSGMSSAMPSAMPMTTDSMIAISSMAATEATASVATTQAPTSVVPSVALLSAPEIIVQTEFSQSQTTLAPTITQNSSAQSEVELSATVGITPMRYTKPADVATPSKTDVNENNSSADTSKTELPTTVVEATAVFVRKLPVVESTDGFVDVPNNKDVPKLNSQL